MLTPLELVRPRSLVEIHEARRRIAGTILRTPLVRLLTTADHPEIRLKLETLQPINPFKLRGAANAVAMLSDSDRKPSTHFLI
jgi:threonine dehydratase